MKFAKLLVSLFLTLIVCSAFTMKDKGTGVYIVGVSASFTDSLIYFSDVQYVDSAQLDNQKFLLSRDQYSDQLKSYLENVQGLKNRTCFIYYGEKKNKLEKTVKKMKAKYNKDGKSILRETGADFKFTKPVEY